MKFFIVVVALLAASAEASATSFAYYASAPLVRTYPYVYSAHSSSLVTPTQQQYQAQDGLGQYAYGYAEPLSAKQEVRSLDGVTRGSYSYRDATGKLQTVDYTADANGFHVAATNLPRAVAQPPFRAPETPTPVADTVDVAGARDAYLAAHQATDLRLAAFGVARSEPATADSGAGRVELRQSGADSIDVAADRADHLKRLGEVADQTAQNERVFTPTVVHTTVPVAYRPTAIIPRVYGYTYPVNSRFLTARVVY